MQNLYSSKFHFYIFAFVFFILQHSIYAQANSDFTNFSSSIMSYGMGEQGAALKNSQDAFTFNPANLTFSEKLNIAYYYNPFHHFRDMRFPFSNVSASAELKNFGAVGIQYTHQNLGEVYTGSSGNPGGLAKTEYLNDAITIGYAGNFSREFSAGISARYAFYTLGSFNSATSFRVNLGINYSPEFLSNGINLGFSLMNLGSPMTYKSKFVSGALEFKDPTPSILHLALSAAPVKTDYISLLFQLGFSRDISAYDGEAKSSFASLIEDWKNFPRDTRVHTGLAFNWQPLSLGNGFSFFQNFYLGTFSPGVWSGNLHYFTHGAEIGIGYKDFNFSAGYAGRWHTVQPYAYTYFRQILPFEAVQFNIGWDINKYIQPGKAGRTPSPLSGILVSAGTGYNFRAGHLSPESSGFGKFDVKSRNGFSYSLESAFYMNRNSALIAGIFYSSVPFAYDISYPSGYKFEWKTKLEIAGIYSDYRYHPLEAVSPFYIQGGLGIIRINPVAINNPKYFYQTAFNSAAGYNLDLFNNNFIITPEINYQLMLLSISRASALPRIGGENQLSMIIKAGLRF